MFQVKNKCYISGDIFLFWWSLELHTPSKPATSGLPFSFIRMSAGFGAQSQLRLRPGRRSRAFFYKALDFSCLAFSGGEEGMDFLNQVRGV